MMAVQERVYIEDIVTKIKKHAEDVDNTRVYIVMKKMNVGYISAKSVDFMKTLIALNDFGLPITATMVSSLRGGGEANALSTLHGYGDKHLITLKRREKTGQRGNPYVWFISHAFAELYYGKGRQGDVEE